MKSVLYIPIDNANKNDVAF